MTDRARVRELYKAKKRLPAPEIVKPRPHRGKKKNFIIEMKWVPDEKAKETPWFMRLFNNKKKLDWSTYRKYCTGVDAAKALSTLESHPRFNSIFGAYEYRLREIK